MKRRLLGALALVSLAITAQAAQELRDTDIRPELAGLEQVDSIPALTRLHSWRAVDERRLIVWATAFSPYLVELQWPSHDLRFARAIEVTSFGSRVHARFDAVQIDGIRYPISRIYRLEREEARERSFKW